MSQQEDLRPGGQPQCPRQRNYLGVFTEQEGREGSGLSRERGLVLRSFRAGPDGLMGMVRSLGFILSIKPLESSNQNNMKTHVLFMEDPSGR